MNGAGEESGPVPFKERLVGAVQPSDGARLADKSPRGVADMNLLLAIPRPLGDETNVLKRAAATQS